MSGTILLFGFDSLLNILALSAAVSPFDAEVVPVARGDYNKPMGSWPDWIRRRRPHCPMPAARWAGAWWCCADWMIGWSRCLRR